MRHYRKISHYSLCESESVSHSVVPDFATPWTVALQVPLSTEFSKAGILEWVSTPFSIGSSWPRDRTHVSCTASRLFTVWVTREAPSLCEDSESESCSVLSDSSWPHGLYSPWNSPDQNTGVGSLSLLQGTFPTQGSNPGLTYCRRILYQLNHQGSPVYCVSLGKWIALD